jgi:Flp pilus assembly secretin CpaC
MRWRVFGCGKRRSHAARVCGLILCVALSIATHRVAAADLAVIMDEAKLIRLPDKVATIVIGNPMIADVSLQPGGIMVITGKGYGSTNGWCWIAPAPC